MTNRKADNLLLFKSIVDCGSLSLAATTCNISISQASKRMTHLESTLGIQLLHRSTRKMALTPAGEVLYKKLEDIKFQIDDAWQSMLEYTNEPKGEISISCPIYFGLNKLIAFTKQFNCNHPQINIDLKLLSSDQQLEDTNYDINFLSHKVGPNQLIPDANLCAKRTHSEKLVYVASTSYIEQFGKPNHPEELGKHKCLAINNTKANQQWTFYNGQAPFRQSIDVAFETNNFETLIRAAEHGMGIAHVPESFLEKNKDMVVLFEEYNKDTLDTYAYYNKIKLASKKVSLFLSELQKYTETTSNQTA